MNIRFEIKIDDLTKESWHFMLLGGDYDQRLYLNDYFVYQQAG